MDPDAMKEAERFFDAAPPLSGKDGFVERLKAFIYKQNCSGKLSPGFTSFALP
jgi:hypothetical protein